MDPKLVDDGLAAICSKSKKATIFEADTDKIRDWWFQLAQEAWMQGAGERFGGTQKVLDEPTKLLSVQDHLGPMFIRALERVGLKPIL